MRHWLAHPQSLSKAEWLIAANFGVAAFAMIAAVLWFVSAYGELPQMISYWDYTPENDSFYRAVRFSAKMNRFAAAAAGLSALCAAAVALLSLPS